MITSVVIDGNQLALYFYVYYYVKASKDSKIGCYKRCNTFAFDVVLINKKNIRLNALLLNDAYSVPSYIVTACWRTQMVQYKQKLSLRCFCHRLYIYSTFPYTPPFNLYAAFRFVWFPGGLDHLSTFFVSWLFIINLPIHADEI